MRHGLQGLIGVVCVALLVTAAAAFEPASVYDPTVDVTQAFPVPYLEFWSLRDGVREVRSLVLASAREVFARLATEYRQAAAQDPPATIRYRVYVHDRGRYLLLVFWVR